MEWSGKTVVVLGLGASGRAAAMLARAKGATVIGTDSRLSQAPLDGVMLELGPPRLDRFRTADLVITSPGVPPTNPALIAACEAGVPVVGELGFAAQYIDVPVVAITGTNGKSTVTYLTGQLLTASGFTPFVGGNFGTAVSHLVLDPKGADVAVLEVSSYQLERAGRFAPEVSVILNLSPDHLARHGDMPGYARAKAKMFDHLDSQLRGLPNDALLQEACAGKGGTAVHLGSLPGVQRQGHQITVQLPGQQAHVFDVTAFAVPGEHNLDNLASALLLSMAVGASADKLQAAIATLKALAHRMEIVAKAKDIWWINDSKATNLDASSKGIAGLARPALVLLGGQAKRLEEGLGFGSLAPLLQRHKAVICFGADGPIIAQELQDAGVTVTLVDSMEQAAQAAAQSVQPGQAVLLSPGCASFDAFDNFEHRGQVFTRLALELS